MSTDVYTLVHKYARDLLNRVQGAENHLSLPRGSKSLIVCMPGLGSWQVTSVGGHKFRWEWTPLTLEAAPVKYEIDGVASK